MVKFLLDKGADVNAPGNKEEGSPLLVLIARQDKGEFEKLIAKTISTAAVALHRSKWIQEREAELQIEAKERKAEAIKSPDETEFLSVSERYGSIKEMIMDQLGTPYEPYLFAKEVCQGEVEVMIEEGDLDGANGARNMERAQFHQNSRFTRPNNEHPFQTIMKRNVMKLAQILVDKGADVNFKARDKATPLHCSVRQKYEEFVRFLIANGADVNAGTKQGFTPFHVTCQQGNIEMAKLLLANGAEVNLGTNRGISPLHIVAQMGDTDMARFLLSHGAELDGLTDKGSTPLCFAIEQGHADTAAFLISMRANVNVKSIDGITPLHLATRHENLDCAKVKFLELI